MFNSSYTSSGKVKYGRKTKKAGKTKTQVSSDDVPTTSQQKSSKTEAANKTCILCREADHWANQFPFRGKVKELIKEGKIVTVTFKPRAISD